MKNNEGPTGECDGRASMVVQSLQQNVSDTTTGKSQAPRYQSKLELAAPRTLRPLRPRQERGLEALRASLASGHRRTILQGPTGIGKTLLSAHIIRAALNKGNPVAFLVPALSLVDQTVAALELEGIDCVGVIQGDHERTDPSQPVQVCSVQTLARRERPDVSLVIVDEAHLAFQSVHDWMADQAWVRTPFIGLSATPWTKGLGRHYSDLTIIGRTRECIEEGDLCDFLAYAPSVPDLSQVGTVAGEFHQGELEQAVNKTTLVGDIVETWFCRGEDRQTLLYGAGRAHALHCCERFQEAGVPSAYIDALTPREERERIFQQFREKEIRIICNVATLTVGLDFDVRCIIDARPTRSEMRFVQTIGRGLRNAPGKKNLLILDHAGNHLRLGSVRDIDLRHDKLDDGSPNSSSRSSRTRAIPLPRLCEECSALLERGASACWNCGKVRHAKTDVLTAEGELVPLGTGASSARSPTMDEKLQFLRELRGFARERGF